MHEGIILHGNKKKKEEKNQKIFIHEYVLFSSSFLIIFRSFG